MVGADEGAGEVDPGAAYAAATCESVSSTTVKRPQSILAVRFMNLIPRMNISVQNSALVLKGGCNANILNLTVAEARLPLLTWENGPLLRECFVWWNATPALPWKTSP